MYVTNYMPSYALNSQERVLGCTSGYTYFCLDTILITTWKQMIAERKRIFFKITQLKARSDGEPIMIEETNLCKNGRKNNSTFYQCRAILCWAKLKIVKQNTRLGVHINNPLIPGNMIST